MMCSRLVAGRDALVDIPTCLVAEHNVTTRIWSDSTTQPLRTGQSCDRLDRELVEELVEDRYHLLGVGRV